MDRWLLKENINVDIPQPYSVTFPYLVKSITFFVEKSRKVKFEIGLCDVAVGGNAVIRAYLYKSDGTPKKEIITIPVTSATQLTYELLAGSQDEDLSQGTYLFRVYVTESNPLYSLTANSKDSYVVISRAETA